MHVHWQAAVDRADIFSIGSLLMLCDGAAKACTRRMVHLELLWWLTSLTSIWGPDLGACGSQLSVPVPIGVKCRLDKATRRVCAAAVTTRLS
jgi:hypothetical protein